MKLIGLIILFSLVNETSFGASVLVKRYVVDKRLISGSDLTAYMSYKTDFKDFKTKQPAEMFEQYDLPFPNTNYFTISGSTQNQFQNDTILTLEGKGIIKLMDTLELVNIKGVTVETIHTEFYKPKDWDRDWLTVEVSSK